jgi:hypothetical protein
MKLHLTFLSAFFVLIMMSSCKQDANLDKFEKSYHAWLQLKKTSKNNYQYIVKFSSWTGQSSETTVTVFNGQVQERSYRATALDSGSPPSVVVQEEWTERVDELNTHQRGAPTKTLDEIYADAKSNWLIKRDKATTYFEAKNNGIISLAGYVEDGCQDDCFHGISISYVEDISYRVHYAPVH